MESYCQNVDTGKYHLVKVLSLVSIDGVPPQAEIDDTPLSYMPSDGIFGGVFKIENGSLHFLPSDKVIPFKK